MPRNSRYFYEMVIYDSNYKSIMAGIVPRIQSLAKSDEFKAAIGTMGETASKDLDMLIVGLYESAGSKTRDDMIAAFDRSEDLTAFFNLKNENGLSFMAALNSAAVAKDMDAMSANGGVATKGKSAVETLYEDIYYLNDKLNMGLDLAKLLPSSVRPKKKMEGEPSWKNYMKAHLTEVPFGIEERQDYLAKAMIAAFKDKQMRMSPEQATAFSVKSARKYAESLKKNPMFQTMALDRNKVGKILEEGAKKPESLVKVLRQIYSPFCLVPEKTRKDVLTRLKKMVNLIDGPDNRSSKWQALYTSLNSIDMDNPEACGVEKLQEIYDATVKYMKGKKSLRSRADEANRFDQALDILAELAKCGEFAKMNVQTVYDRVNEVRSSKDERYKNIHLHQYGAMCLVDHTNSNDEIKKASYYSSIRYPDGRRPREIIPRKVFEGYPNGDMSKLPLWMPARGKNCVTVKDAVNGLKDFIKNGHREKTHNAVKCGIALALALPETNMYYLKTGTRVGKATAVVDSEALQRNMHKYLSDPAVDRLSEMYRAPYSRDGLTDEFGSPFSIKHDVLRAQLEQIKRDMRNEAKQNKEINNKKTDNKVINNKKIDSRKTNNKGTNNKEVNSTKTNNKDNNKKIIKNKVTKK